MSMLAERKRKQKWSLNPRGKDWAQDTNKFGHKMLEKMGWSQGKGLGANEDGLREHIKVSHKNDSTGIGYKESDDQWTEHESNFSALLQALGGGEQKDHEIKLNSLELKSQNSRVRVHYKKFTRGKDLSRYSEKDLANIFGKKSLKELKKTKRVEPQMEQDVKEEHNSKVTEKSNLFSHGGLISDYFKKKFPSFGNANGFVVGNNGVLQKADDSESESEARPSFGFGFQQESEKLETFEEEGNKTFVISKEKSRVQNNFVSFAYENSAEDGFKRKKSKKKRNLDGMTIEDTPTKKKKLDPCAAIEGTPTKKKKLEPSDVHADTPIKKKKEKSKIRLQMEPYSGMSNPAFDPLSTPIKVEKHILEPIEESLCESLLNDTVGEVAERFEVKVQINNESTPVGVKSKHGIEDDRKKRKKKKKDKTNDQNESLDQSLNQLKLKKNKKQKNTEAAEEIIGTSSSYSSDVNSLEDTITNTVSLKKDKKIKKNKANSIESLNGDHEQSATLKRKKSKTNISQEGLDNPFFNMSIENEESVLSQTQTDNPFEVKKKKKKKSKEGEESHGLENPVFNGEDSVNSQDVANEAFEVKRKDRSKKKKKDREPTKGLDNPALNLDDTIDESCDLMLNVVATPPIIKNKESTRTLRDSLNIQKVSGVKRRKSVRFSDVTRERIIPNKDEIEQDAVDDSTDIIEVEGKLNDSSELSYIDKCVQKRKAKKRKQGLDNTGFDKQATSMEENITSISNTLDAYQAEIENDMNEAKLKSVEIEDIMVGEVGNPDGTNEVLPDGSVKLKFKHAKFSKSARFIDGLTGAKKSYKHLIKGDIVMKFTESNLHEIDGYAVKVS